jgi:molecular chaperone DnaK (HSP70)
MVFDLGGGTFDVSILDDAKIRKATKVELAIS